MKLEYKYQHDIVIEDGEVHFLCEATLSARDIEQIQAVHKCKLKKIQPHLRLTQNSAYAHWICAIFDIVEETESSEKITIASAMAGTNTFYIDKEIKTTYTVCRDETRLRIFNNLIDAMDLFDRKTRVRDDKD